MYIVAEFDNDYEMWDIVNKMFKTPHEAKKYLEKIHGNTSSDYVIYELKECKTLKFILKEN